MNAISFSAVRAPLCSFCDLPVSINNAKTDEDGNAIHEDCYLRKLGVKPTSSGVIDVSEKKLTPIIQRKRSGGAGR